MAQVYALLADGTTVEIRPAGPGDFNAVKAMHEAMSPDNTYMRFFNISRLAAEIEAGRICREPVPGQMALLAISDGEVVGVASYVSEVPAQAEVAFAVADHMHNRGVATLLLEHLVSFARSHQITTFTAETLTENKAMLNVFADAGLPIDRHYEDGVFKLTFPLPGADTGPTLEAYLNAVAEREGRAETASLRHVLAPESVAVIGASRRRGTVGRAILDNIRAGRYAGRLYTVNQRARQICGERCLSSVLDLPEAVDMAVIAVPAASVLDIAERCGQRGVRSLVVITSGLDTAACADLLAVCRRHGMRLVGPDCFGVAVPGIGLDATFAASPARPGVAGLVMQSGALGLAVVDHLSRLGIGTSSFASVGEKLDVSSNDMLMWWEHDGLTKLAVLYIESFGNPRKFARTARRVSGTMPVLTVLADRWPPHRPPWSAGRRCSSKAGVIATHGFGDLIEAAALLATQPVPAGRTVAIVSNVGGAGVLAADACTDLGLSVHHPAGLTRRRLRMLAPAGTVTGPVDMTAPVRGRQPDHRGRRIDPADLSLGELRPRRLLPLLRWPRPGREIGGGTGARRVRGADRPRPPPLRRPADRDPHPRAAVPRGGERRRADRVPREALKHGVADFEEAIVGFDGIREKHFGVKFADGSIRTYDRGFSALGWYDMHQAIPRSLGASFDPEDPYGPTRTAASSTGGPSDPRALLHRGSEERVEPDPRGLGDRRAVGHPRLFLLPLGPGGASPRSRPRRHRGGSRSPRGLSRRRWPRPFEAAPRGISPGAPPERVMPRNRTRARVAHSPSNGWSRTKTARSRATPMSLSRRSNDSGEGFAPANCGSASSGRTP